MDELCIAGDSSWWRAKGSSCSQGSFHIYQYLSTLYSSQYNIYPINHVFITVHQGLVTQSGQSPNQHIKYYWHIEYWILLNIIESSLLRKDVWLTFNKLDSWQNWRMHLMWWLSPHLLFSFDIFRWDGKPKVSWFEIFRHKCPKRQLAKFIQAKTKEKTWMEQNGSIWLKRPRVAYFNGPENSNLWNATNSNLQNFKVMWFIFLNQPVNMSKSCIYPISNS